MDFDDLNMTRENYKDKCWVDVCINPFFSNTLIPVMYVAMNGVIIGQGIAACSAKSHYLNQGWLIVNLTLINELQRRNQKEIISIEKVQLMYITSVKCIITSYNMSNVHSNLILQLGQVSSTDHLNFNTGKWISWWCFELSYIYTYICISCFSSYNARRKRFQLIKNMFFKTGLWHAQYITANVFKIGTVICRVLLWLGTIGFSTLKSIAVFNRIVDELPSWSLNSPCHPLSSSFPIIYQTKNRC